MTVTNTSLLGLALPTTGTESGVWGDDVNNGLTILIDVSVAGTNNITQDSDITLAVSNGNNSSSFTSTATNSAVAQYYVLNCSGARTALRNIIVPTTSKTYVVTNGTTGGFGITVKKSGGTGVTVAAGETAIVFYNTVTGDVAKVTSTVNVSSFTAGTTGFTPSTATTGAVTLAGTLATTNGGTGLTSFTSGGVVYASSTSALATGAALTFDGNVLSTQKSTSGDAFKWSSATGKTAYAYVDGSGIGVFTGASVTGTGFYANDTASYFATYIGSAEQMRLTSTGLGIGTSSPSAKLDVVASNFAGGPAISARYNTSNARIGFNIANSNGFPYIGYNTNNVSSSDTPTYDLSQAAAQLRMDNGQFHFNTATSGTAGNAITFTQAMTLDASGNLQIGTTNSASSRLRVLGASSGGGVAYIDTNGAFAGTDTATLGFSVFQDSGVRYNSQAEIRCIGDGNYSGSLAFFTQNAGTYPNTVAERARIDSSGNLLVGTTSNLGSYKTCIVSVNNAFATSVASTAASTQVAFFNPNGAVGSITTSGTLTSYNVMSDQRLKANITDAAPASALIDSLQVRQYDWKSDGSHQRYGFIAQELVVVVPEAVHQPEDLEEMMAVDYSKLVPMLVKEIQSLRKRLADAGIA